MKSCKFFHQFKTLISEFPPSPYPSYFQELFSSVGKVRRVRVEVDKRGKFAKVEFKYREDAFKAEKDFNGRLLDGQPMKIEIVPSKVSVRLISLICFHLLDPLV